MTDIERPNYLYILIPASTDPSLSDRDVRVLAFLANVANQQGISWYSNKAIGKALGKSVASIKRAKKTLREQGYIACKSSEDNQSTVLQIAITDLRGGSPVRHLRSHVSQDGSPLNQGGRNSEPGVAHLCAPKQTHLNKPNKTGQPVRHTEVAKTTARARARGDFKTADGSDYRSQIEQDDPNPVYVPMTEEEGRQLRAELEAYDRMMKERRYAAGRY